MLVAEYIVNIIVLLALLKNVGDIAAPLDARFCVDAVVDVAATEPRRPILIDHRTSEAVPYGMPAAALASGRKRNCWG